jgi:hypothetical protein
MEKFYTLKPEAAGSAEAVIAVHEITRCGNSPALGGILELPWEH